MYSNLRVRYIHIIDKMEGNWLDVKRALNLHSVWPHEKRNAFYGKVSDNISQEKSIVEKLFLKAKFFQRNFLL